MAKDDQTLVESWKAKNLCVSCGGQFAPDLNLKRWSASGYCLACLKAMHRDAVRDHAAKAA